MDTYGECCLCARTLRTGCCCRRTYAAVIRGEMARLPADRDELNPRGTDSATAAVQSTEGTGVIAASLLSESRSGLSAMTRK
jgi:hypothetical protein